MYFLYCICISAHLQEQLAALQERCEDDQNSSQKAVMRLRSRLQQEREEAQKEAQALREELHASHCSQVLYISQDNVI